MKKSLTVRLQPELLEAARSCAAREHRSLTNFIEASLLARIGETGVKAAVAQPFTRQGRERPNHGE